MNHDDLPAGPNGPNQGLSISQQAMEHLRPAHKTGDGAPWLQGLNAAQLEAVEAIDGPVLVLAGAGTGKTKVLTARLANIVGQGKARASEILSVTFTNKAAREMRHRAEALIGQEARYLRWLGTFHSVSAQMLRAHAELVGLKSSFIILDTDDCLRLLKQVIEAEGLDAKRWAPRFLAGLIDNWKNKAWKPAQVPADESFLFAGGKGAKLYGIYQERLKTLNSVDFGDLLLHMIDIFKAHPDVLADYHRRFRYLMVDEYQDTNVAQYLWLRLLAQAHNNLCVVGDDDQSIYGWRGAEVENILRFEQDFAGAKVVRLERNYRSTGHILGAASGLIANNSGRLGKTLWTDDGDGDHVRVRGVWDGDGEAQLIADDIESFVKGPRRYDETAILVRAAWQMRAFEDRFIRLHIPYKVIGGPRFFERQEIRDAHAYLRLIQSSYDDLAFERVVNRPKRGIGDTSFAKLVNAARQNGVSLFDIANSEAVDEILKGAAKTGMNRFIRSLEAWRKAAPDIPLQELAERVLEESGYIDMLKADKTPQGPGRLENLQELVRSMASIETLGAYLEHISLVMDLETETDGDGVQILTLHAAKGLEWPYVFLPGWEEEVFPSKRALDESGAEALEEERRLAYVGITRAREKAAISFAANRQIYGRWMSVLPSRFIDELPQTHVNAISDTGYFHQTDRHNPDRFAAYGPLSTPPGDGFTGQYDTPGWRRAQSAAQQSTAQKMTSPPRQFLGSAPILDGQARVVRTSAKKAHAFNVGERIFHDKFGYGKVTAIEAEKLAISFEKSGEKMVLASFVQKT